MSDNKDDNFSFSDSNTCVPSVEFGEQSCVGKAGAVNGQGAPTGGASENSANSAKPSADAKGGVANSMAAPAGPDPAQNTPGQPWQAYYAAGDKSSGKKGFDFSQAQPLSGVFFLPESALPKKPWRKRHPWLFRLAALFVLFMAVGIAGSFSESMEEAGMMTPDTIGIVRIDGMIMESGATVAWIDKLRENPKVHGVLLRINSPGGAVVPSQEIHMAIKRLAAKKPVVVSMGTAAASGGYYIAVAADYIVANPSTLTGSIGVRMDLINAQKLADFIGIQPQGLSSGPLKEAGSPYRPLREDERAYLQGMVQDMYDVFVEYVAAGRKMDIKQVRALADGRAYTGRQALELGLVDELGDYGAALQKLVMMSGLKETPDAKNYLIGPPSKQSWVSDLLGSALEHLGFAKADTGGMPYGFYY